MANISFRPIVATDLEFLKAVYASTRLEELAIIGWDQKLKSAFLEMQFSAQHHFYQQHYQEAEFLIILLDDEPIGRFYIARWPEEIRIVDLAILPEFRNTGHGTKILENLLTEAATVGKPVTLHVERFNPALKLYQRLGFVKTGEEGVYNVMTCSGNKL